MATIDDRLDSLANEIKKLELAPYGSLSRAEALRICRLMLSTLSEIRAMIDESTY